MSSRVAVVLILASCAGPPSFFGGEAGPGDGAADGAADRGVDRDGRAEGPDSADAGRDSPALEAALPDGPASDLPPGLAHSRCASAKKVTLGAGKGSVAGDTTGAVNEYASAITCGTAYALAGPQLYFSVALAAQQTYKIALAPSFVAYLYVFPENGCGSASSINGACGKAQSGGVAGPIGPGAKGAVVLTPSAAGTFVVAVDSTSASLAGTFTLSVAPFAAAANDTCAKAQALAFSSGKASVSGDTLQVKNEHGSLACGGAAPLAGPQVYYKASLDAGQPYRASLAPEFLGYLYVFPASACSSAKSIEDACSSGGKTGALIGPVSPGKTGDLHFTPATSEAFVLAVDSIGSGEAGAFTLELAPFSLATGQPFAAPLSWDFDQDCQKLGKTGDWECGAYAFSATKACDAPLSMSPPKAPYSGKGMWGTVLNDCHAAKANADSPCTNKNPSDDSILYFDVSLPKTWKQATLTYQSWDDYLLPFDWSEVRIDGKVAAQSCKGPKPSTVSWVQRSVDLSAHVGKTITVSFHFMASDAVSLSGWYVDDLAVTGN